MSMAWETTVDDVRTAIERYNGYSCADVKFVQECYDDLSFEEIEDAVLHGDDMDEQTEYARQEIIRQLIDCGHLSTYKIIRFYHPATGRGRVELEELDDGSEATGLSLAEAQEHCNSPYSQVAGEYLDGYDRE